MLEKYTMNRDREPISITNSEFNAELAAVKERTRDIPIALIIPPSPFLADEKVFPFLGPLKVATELRKNHNHVEVLDLSGWSNYIDKVREYAEETGIRTFGITATTPQIPSAVQVAEAIREALPDAKIILGGPHATLCHSGWQQDIKHQREGRGTSAFMQLTEIFDKIVVGDGETAVFYALDPQEDSQIIDASSIKSPLFMRKDTLDNYGNPSRDLIDMKNYHYYIDGHRAFSVIGQLGCPFECGFCGGRDSQVFRMARTRSVDEVVSEIEDVMKISFEEGYPMTGVMFYDDELNVNPGTLESLCKGLVGLQEKLVREYTPQQLENMGLQVDYTHGEPRLDMRFRGFVKAELFTQEQADLMYQAGFRVLLSGVESGSDKILGAMKKHTSREINTRCAQYAHNAGLSFKALMSIGHPGETETTIGESIEWAISNLREGDEVDWTIITQYPGSPYFDHSIFVPEKNAWLYETMDKNGESLKLWSSTTDYTRDTHYYKGVPGDYTAYVWTDGLSPQDLVKLRDLAEEVTKSRLNLPTVSHIAAMQFDHSMGQGLHEGILRTTSSL